MSRDLSPEFRDAIAARDLSPALLVHLDIEEDPVRAWTGIGRLWWAGWWWEGVGALGALEPIEETTDIRAVSVRAMLNRVPNHALATVPALTWKGRLAEIDLVLIDPDTREILAAEAFFRGKMDTLTIERGAEGSTLEVVLVNDLVILKETWGSNYTMESHRALYPADTALRFVPYIQDQKIHF